MKKRKRASAREVARRREQSFKDKGGSLLDDGDGGVIRANPVKGGWRLDSKKGRS
jgi:hypothetical protein